LNLCGTAATNEELMDTFSKASFNSKEISIQSTLYNIQGLIYTCNMQMDKLQNEELCKRGIKT